MPKSHRESELVVSSFLALDGDGNGNGNGNGEPDTAQGTRHPRVARFADVRNTIALRRASESLGKYSLDSGDDFDRLVQHDLAHGTELVTTMRAYLDLAGSVRDAAAALHVHQNTLRYRLASVTDSLGIDLGDPHTRLWLWLRLTAATFTASS